MTANVAWLLTLAEPWELMRQINGEYHVKVGTWLTGPEPVHAYGSTVEYALMDVRAKYEAQRRAA